MHSDMFALLRILTQRWTHGWISLSSLTLLECTIDTTSRRGGNDEFFPLSAGLVSWCETRSHEDVHFLPFFELILRRRDATENSHGHMAAGLGAGVNVDPFCLAGSLFNGAVSRKYLPRLPPLILTRIRPMAMTDQCSMVSTSCPLMQTTST